MGDVEQGIDPTLLARGLPRVDVLKVAHHGSATASTQPFVDAVRPRVAIASAGAGNPYGHPARSTLDRLRASGARVYRTDQDGSVEVELREDGLSVHETGARPAAATTVAAAATAFLCAIPVPSGSPAWVASPETPAAPPVAQRWNLAETTGAASAWADPTGYDPLHDDPRSPRSRPPAGVPASVGQVHPARLRRRRHRGLPRVPGEPGGTGRRPSRWPRRPRCSTTSTSCRRRTRPPTSGTARGRRPGSRRTATRSSRPWSGTTR